MCQVSRLFKFAALMLSVVLVGCASSAAQINTWEGSPQEASNPAVLTAPGAIQVKSVNGQSMTTYLIDDLALDYGLLPGENEVVFTYKTIWAKAGVIDNGESKVHTVESKPQVARFSAEAGASYQFDYDKPSNRRDAQAMMESFSADIVTESGEVVVSSSEWDGKSAFAAARTPIPAASGGNSASTNATGNTLDQLKTIWADATEEEKRTFLRWAFE